MAELERGREAYAAEAWLDAYESLSAADQSDPLGAEDLELLATSAYMLGREDEYLACSSAPTAPTSTPARRWRAAALRVLDRRHPRQPGEMGRASGWLGRAQRLLERAGR